MNLHYFYRPAFSPHMPSRVYTVSPDSGISLFVRSKYSGRPTYRIELHSICPFLISVVLIAGKFKSLPHQRIQIIPPFIHSIKICRLIQFIVHAISDPAAAVPRSENLNLSCGRNGKRYRFIFDHKWIS